MVWSSFFSSGPTLVCVTTWSSFIIIYLNLIFNDLFSCWDVFDGALGVGWGMEIVDWGWELGYGGWPSIWGWGSINCFLEHDL